MFSRPRPTIARVISRSQASFYQSFSPETSFVIAEKGAKHPRDDSSGAAKAPVSRGINTSIHQGPLSTRRSPTFKSNKFTPMQLSCNFRTSPARATPDAIVLPQIGESATDAWPEMRIPLIPTDYSIKQSGADSDVFASKPVISTMHGHADHVSSVSGLASVLDNANLPDAILGSNSSNETFDDPLSFFRVSKGKNGPVTELFKDFVKDFTESSESSETPHPRGAEMEKAGPVRELFQELLEDIVPSKDDTIHHVKSSKS